MENLSSSSPWTAAQRIGFRFAFIFFTLVIVLQNSGAFPFWDLLMTYPNKALHVIIPWIGKHLLHLPYEVQVITGGSGDTTYDWLTLFTIFVAAVLGCMVWSLVDRKKTDGYPTLYYWLTVGIRFFVGLMLINYGLYKIFKLQLPAPSLFRLMQPYGNSSPMGLAWTFFGFSKGYNLFMGVAELLAGLLLFRRTLTLGAFITLLTAANIVAVNYCYDVPVKIMSSMLLVMCFFLLLRNFQQLWQFFFTARPVMLDVITAPQFSKKWMRITKTIFKTLLIGYTVLVGGYELMKAEQEYGDNAPKPKLSGLYNTTLFVRGGDTIPSLRTDSTRWHRMMVVYGDFCRVVMSNDSTRSYGMKPDTIKHTILFTDDKDTLNKFTLLYHEPIPGKFSMTGKMGTDSVRIEMDRITDIEKYFRLTSRGFHWISEYPFNR